MNNENNPKLNESQLVENIDVNQSGEAPKAVKKTTVIIAVVLIIVSVCLMVLGINLMTKGNGNTKPVNTEFATTPEGVVIVEKGTNPQGVIIENGTYPDGTVVEIATTPQGEPATDANGSYIVNYPTYSGTESTPNSNVENNNNSNSNSSAESSNKDNANQSTSSEATTTSANSDNTASSNNTDSSNSSSSSTTSSSTSSNNQSNNQSNSSQTSSNTSSENTSSSTTNDIAGSSSVTINGSNYNVGDRVKVTYYLECPVKFAALDCEINYDGSVLKLDKSTVKTPNLVNVMTNPDLDNMIAFLCASATAVNDFSEKKEFFSCEFEIQKSNTNTADVVANVVEMLDNDIMNISSDKYSMTASVEKIS